MKSNKDPQQPASGESGTPKSDFEHVGEEAPAESSLERSRPVAIRFAVEGARGNYALGTATVDEGTTLTINLPSERAANE